MTDQSTATPVNTDACCLSRRSLLRLAGMTAAAMPAVALTKQNVDYLVHEAIDEHWVDTFVAPLPPDVQGPAKAHLLGAHTTLAQVGHVAEQAHARNLVLTHLIPENIDRAHFREVRDTFSGRLVIAEDLMELASQSAHDSTNPGRPAPVVVGVLDPVHDRVVERLAGPPAPPRPPTSSPSAPTT